MSGSKLSLPAAAPPLPPPPATQPDTPLNMTVHSLPDAGQNGAVRTQSGRWKMLAVLLVCAAPVVASYFTFYVVRPEGRRNYGELVQPARSLPDQAALSLDGVPSNLRELKGQWLLVSVSSGNCGTQCEKNLYLQRQLRESLGRDKDRLDRVWLISDNAAVRDALRPAIQDAVVLRVAPTALAQWLQTDPTKGINNHLMLVDPMGNFMMRFPAEIDGALAKRDVERLLRASSSWDRAGR